jgi:hypothetical protein
MAWVQIEVTGAFSRHVMTSRPREDAVAFTSGVSLMIERPARGGVLHAEPGTMRKPTVVVPSHADVTRHGATYGTEGRAQYGVLERHTRPEKNRERNQSQVRRRQM